MEDDIYYVEPDYSYFAVKMIRIHEPDSALFRTEEITFKGTGNQEASSSKSW